MKKQYRLRKRLLTSLISAAVATSAAGPTILWAQTADATLRGRAAANSEVTAKNIATGAVRRTKAADDYRRVFELDRNCLFCFAPDYWPYGEVGPGRRCKSRAC